MCCNQCCCYHFCYCCSVWSSVVPFGFQLVHSIYILHEIVRVTSQREFAAVCWKIIYTWMECKGHLFNMLVHAWRIYRFYYHPLDSIQCFLKFKMTLLIKYFTLVALQCVAVFYIYKIHTHAADERPSVLYICVLSPCKLLAHALCFSVPSGSIYTFSKSRTHNVYRKSWLPAILLLLSLYLHKLSRNMKL